MLGVEKLLPGLLAAAFSVPNHNTLHVERRKPFDNLAAEIDGILPATNVFGQPYVTEHSAAGDKLP